MFWTKLFYITILILPFSFALNPATGIDLPIIRALTPLLFILWLLNSLKNKKILIDNRLRFFFFLFFLFLSSISFFWAIEQERAFRKVLFILSLAPIYFLVYELTQDKESRLKILLFLFWSGVLVSLLGILQFSLQFIIGLNSTLNLIGKTITPFFLGETFSKSVLAFPSWLVNIGGKTILRAFGSFPDPHLFSIYLNLVLPLGIFLYIKKKNFSILMGSLLIFLASILSFSRTSYMGLLLGTAFFIFTGSIREYIQKNFLVITILFLLILATLVTSNPISKRFYSSFDITEGSVSGRLEMWRKATEATRNYPLTGVGIGNFSRYIEPQSKLRDPIYAHNLFLDFSSETGILNAVILVLVLISPIISYFFHPTIENRVLATCFVSFLAISLFETPFYSINVFPLILILLAYDTKNN